MFAFQNKCKFAPEQQAMWNETYKCVGTGLHMRQSQMIDTMTDTII